MKKYEWVLLSGLGISQLGNWLYLIALNVMVWQLTHSPAAVAGIYIVGPIVRIVCGSFAGSYIDRWSKRTIVVSADWIRGVLVCLVPFANDLWVIYVLIGLLNVASSFFGPSSTYLITTHVATERKQSFNSLYATINSGAFMIGPALAGGLLAIFQPSIVIWINAATFFMCAAMLRMLPKDSGTGAISKLVTFRTLKEDYQLVASYLKQIHVFVRFVVLYSVALMIAFALDSQEMTFLFTHLHITESLYGVTVTVAGVGAIVGGICATALAKKISAQTYVKVGFLLMTLSYLGFYVSNTYAFAVSCFVTLGFFMAFSNAGFDTLYQRTIDPTLIGRVTSLLNMAQSTLQVMFTAVIGVCAEWFSLQWTVVIFASVAVVFAIFVTRTAFTQKSLSTSFSDS